MSALSILLGVVLAVPQLQEAWVRKENRHYRERVGSGEIPLGEVLDKGAISELDRHAIGIAVRRQMDLSSEELQRVAERSEATDYLLEAVVRHPNTSAATRRGIFERVGEGGEDRRVIWGVAGSPFTPPDILRQLATMESGMVLEEIADNPSTPEDALRLLADDEREHIRRKALANLKQQGMATAD